MKSKAIKMSDEVNRNYSDTENWCKPKLNLRLKQKQKLIKMYFNGVTYNKLVTEHISIQSVFKINHCKIKLEIPWNIIAHVWKSLINIFPSLIGILKIYMTLSITRCEAERNFS